jgi:leucyl aminopeptidase
VVSTRKGLTVEIGNTDAEGRVILCDALAEGAREKPDLMIDMATLTGAARVALGTEVPALFATDDDVADAITGAGDHDREPDLLWRLPLHAGYRRFLDSKIADLCNISNQRYGGAITAALYLAEFAGDGPWVHIDTMGYNDNPQPGRPAGGEVLGVRALFRMLEQRYA